MLKKKKSDKPTVWGSLIAKIPLLDTVGVWTKKWNLFFFFCGKNI